MYGRMAFGISMEPSFCWWFSRMATSQRVVARVPFNVETARVEPSAVRSRMFRRRAWYSVQLEVEVSSR